MVTVRVHDRYGPRPFRAAMGVHQGDVESSGNQVRTNRLEVVDLYRQMVEPARIHRGVGGRMNQLQRHLPLVGQRQHHHPGAAAAHHLTHDLEPERRVERQRHVEVAHPNRRKQDLHACTDHPTVLTDAAQRRHFHRSMFHGYDFDNVMLRIGSMNMLLHGIEAPDIRYRDSLSEGAAADAEKYTLILANPPFAGSLDYEATSKDLQRVVKTKKTELLFLALFLKLLKPGGRAAVIVPDGVLFGSSNAHKELRRILVDDQKLDAVVKLPSGVFRPYAGVSTAILFFTKTNSGGTENVWFYDVHADGFSLDDKRNPVEASDLPDVLARWQSHHAERDRARTDQSFFVPKADIVAQGYDLSLNRYKEAEYDDVEHRAPLEIIADIEQLEDEIARGLADLKAMLS